MQRPDSGHWVTRHIWFSRGWGGLFRFGLAVLFAAFWLWADIRLGRAGFCLLDHKRCLSCGVVFGFVIIGLQVCDHNNVSVSFWGDFAQGDGAFLHVFLHPACTGIHLRSSSTIELVLA